MLHLQKLFAILPLLALMADRSTASPIAKREVPQEQSHKKYLTATQASLQLNNPAGIVDPVFGLLGNGAAKAGAGSITNLDCLQQATADQAFTNAKAAADVEGMTAALVYRALERNTLGVGLKSVACTEVAVNPEIAAIKQHQDPASEGAAAENKAITLELASQIAKVGGEPLVALDAGTFAPGDLGDNTFAGNTCDDADDAEGCIFTKGLLVPDASEAEIAAAVAEPPKPVAAGPGRKPVNIGINIGRPRPAPGAIIPPVKDVIDPAADGKAVGVPLVGPAGEAIPHPPAVEGPAVDAGAGGGNPAPAAGLGVGVGGGAAAPPAVEGGAAAAPALDVGPCTDFSMTFSGGNDGRKATEFTFIPTDRASFPQSSALNPNIITNAMCDGFVNGCAKSAATRDACKVIAADLKVKEEAGELKRDQGFADAWLVELEAALGVKSTGQGSGGPAVIAPPAPPAAPLATAHPAAPAPAAAAVAPPAPSTPPAPTDTAVPPPPPAPAAAAPPPPVVAPEAAAEVDKGRGPGKLGNFIQGIINKHGKGNAGAAAGEAAEASFSAVAAPPAPSADGAGAGVEVGAGGEVNVEVNAPAVNVNVQTFKGALNGKAAPPIVESAGRRPFSVNGNTFQTVGAAINRSCAIQHNACANAFNNGEGTADVAACDAQEKDCLAAGQASAVAGVKRSRIFEA